MMYVKKPIPVEAYLLSEDRDEWPEWLINSNIVVGEHGIIINTLEGEMFCRWGNYVIKGIKDELYPCEKSIFEETYDVYVG